jgi:heptosyltransferase II
MSPHSPQRVLVIRHRFIGDTLLTVPFLQALRRRLPQAHITLVASKNSGELLQHCPYIDELVFFEKKGKDSASDVKPLVLQGFWEALRYFKAEQFNTAFILKRSFSSAALVALAGIPQRIGFNTEGRGFLLTHRFPYPPYLPPHLAQQEKHEAETFLTLLQALPQTQQGEDNDPKTSPDTSSEALKLEIWLSETDRQNAESLWQKETREYSANTLHIGLHPISSNPMKDWPLERFAQLMQTLHVRSENAVSPFPLVFHGFGSPADVALYARLKTLLKDASESVPTLLIWAGKADLTTSQALMPHLYLMLGVDSGTLHMAAAAGVPTLTLFGPTSPQRWRPLSAGSSVLQLGLPCQPCHLKTPCTFNKACLNDLPVSQVEEEVWRFVSSGCDTANGEVVLM